VVPQILEALPHAIRAGFRLPIVYNTSAYDSLDSLRLLAGVVDVYMPDFKLWRAESARRYLKRADYPGVARETIKAMHCQVGDLVLDESGLARGGLILRHLVMPALLVETEAILRWIAEELGTAWSPSISGRTRQAHGADADHRRLRKRRAGHMRTCPAGRHPDLSFPAIADYAVAG
jgi:putative pyruvate formate lyase activating enzyme